MGLSTIFRYVNKKLKTKKGLQRFAWDLRAKGPWHKEEKRRFKNGPIVPPGSYTVQLTVGNKRMTQNFEILLDPRVKEEGMTDALLQKQHKMQGKINLLLSEARLLQDRLENEIKSSKIKDGEANGRLEQLKTALKQLKNDEGAYPQQMLISQISYIYNIVNGADQVIGVDTMERYDELMADFAAIKNKVQ